MFWSILYKILTDIVYVSWFYNIIILVNYIIMCIVLPVYNIIIIITDEILYNAQDDCKSIIVLIVTLLSYL